MSGKWWAQPYLVGGRTAGHPSGPPPKSGRTTPPIGPDRPTNRAGPPPQSGRTAPQIGPATRPDHLEIGPDHRPKVVRPTWPRWLGQRVRTVFCGSGPFFAGRTAVRTVFCGSGPNGRPSARGPDMRAGPRASRGGQPGGRPRRKSGRTNPRIGPDGRPDHPPNRAGRVAGRASGRRPPPLCGMRAQPEIGLTGVFFAHFFCGGRERCTFPTAQWP